MGELPSTLGSRPASLHFQEAAEMEKERVSPRFPSQLSLLPPTTPTRPRAPPHPQAPAVLLPQVCPHVPGVAGHSCTPAPP